MRRAALLLAAASVALISAAAQAQGQAQPAAEPPLTQEVLGRFVALCQDVKAARGDKPQSMAAMAQIDMDGLAKKNGFAGEEETNALAMRIAMVEMYAPEDPNAQAMLAQVEDPAMKAMIARAQADAPVVKANEQALAACKAR